jgi:type IV secretory pathway VirD2 relaxase
LSDPDDLPRFRPRLGKRSNTARGRASGASFRGALLATLRRDARAGARGKRPVFASPGAKAHDPRARRVVVKAHVQRLRAGGAKAAAAHLRYIERDGVEKDGGKGLLYGPDGPVRRETFEQPRVGEGHQFRLIVSPEDGDKLELTGYVRRLMAQVERDVGRKLEWAAVNHHDTDNAHAHIVIRGVGLDGEELRVDRSYIARGLRWRAQELATEELGLRREVDIERARAREVTQERFTSLDRELERRATGERLELRHADRSGSSGRAALVGRLVQLEAMGLAARTASNEWSLAADWQTCLRQLGTRGDILKQMHRAVRGEVAHYLVVEPGQALSAGDGGERTLVGRVAGKGLADEVKGSFYAVLETPWGEAYRVTLDARAADALRVGDLASLRTKPEPPVRPIDRHIAETARAEGGLCALGRMAADEATTARATRRLAELERQGLVASQGPNRWSVPPDLVERLEERHRGSPTRHRLVVRKLAPALDLQVRHRGPVWLDGVDRGGLAPYGFGAEVARALERRREVLRGLGIAADDPQRVARLRELERRTVGEGIAAQTGRQFLAATPERLRGRVEIGRDDARYAVVVDGARFVVVPASRQLHALAGEEVVLSRNATGRILLKTPDRGPDRGRGR